MRNKIHSLFTLVLFVVITFAVFTTTAYSQEEDVVLVNGEPPLTQLMVGKTIVLLDWILDLKLSKEQELQIKAVLVRAWQSNDRAKMKSTQDVIEVYEGVAKLGEAERNNVKSRLQDVVLQSIQAHPNDELSKIVLSAYASAHGGLRRGPAGQSSTPSAAASRSGVRVGGDGFTGIYRMVRRRANDINSSRGTSGVWIEYITFLPNGNVYWSLPPEGLLHFDPALTARSDPEDWGTYEIRNGEIHVLRGPARKLYVITRNGENLNNPPSLGKGVFIPLPTADGLRLHGNYRRNEREPTISFTADGSFRDGGIFAYLGTIVRPDGSHHKDDGVPGSGTYVIEQNTLELRYSDGRVKRAAFITFPDDLASKPALDSFILYRQETFSRY